MIAAGKKTCFQGRRLETEIADKNVARLVIIIFENLCTIFE